MEIEAFEIIDLLGVGINLHKLKVKRYSTKRHLVTYEEESNQENIVGYIEEDSDLEKLLVWFEERDEDFPLDKKNITDVIDKAPNKEIARFLKMSNQSLSNFKSKNQIPYKAIIPACIFLDWPLNYLLSGDRIAFLVGVWNQIDIEPYLYEDLEEELDWDSFENIVEKIVASLDWVTKECHLNYIQLIEECTGIRCHTPLFNKILNNKLSTMMLLFPGSKFYYKDDPSLEIPDMETLFKNNTYRENRDNRLIDLFDVWMFTSGIKPRIEKFIKNIDSDTAPEGDIQAHIDKAKKYLLPGYYILKEQRPFI